MDALVRWPLHPQPQPHESLSSWISRLAKEYKLSSDALLNNISIKPLRHHLIDRDPPDELIMALAACTGVHETNIRAMTLQSYVPFIIDTLDINSSECLKHYATQYRTLLLPKIKWMSSGVRKRYKKKNTYRLPWILEPYGKEYSVCIECLRTDVVPYDRIYWRLGIMTSCPIHQCLLEPSDYWVARWVPKDIIVKPADENLLAVDKLTFRALTVGEVTLTNGCSMNAAVYVRFLRSLIEEIFCRPSQVRKCRYILLDIWEQLETNLESWYRFKRAWLFELLTFPQRCDVLKAIGFLLKDLPMSLREWQMPMNDKQNGKRQMPSAIAETLLADGC
jgi:hypothetical protein